MGYQPMMLSAKCERELNLNSAAKAAATAAAEADCKGLTGNERAGCMSSRYRARSLEQAPVVCPNDPMAILPTSITWGAQGVFKYEGKYLLNDEVEGGFGGQFQQSLVSVVKLPTEEGASTQETDTASGSLKQKNVQYMLLGATGALMLLAILKPRLRR